VVDSAGTIACRVPQPTCHGRELIHPSAVRQRPRPTSLSWRLKCPSGPIGCACRIMRIAPNEGCFASDRTTTTGRFPEIEQSRMPTLRPIGKKSPNGHVSAHTSPTALAPAKPWTTTTPNRHDSAHASPSRCGAWHRRVSQPPTFRPSTRAVPPDRLAPEVVTGRAFRQPARLLRAAHMDVVLWPTGSARPVIGPVTISQTARFATREPSPIHGLASVTRFGPFPFRYLTDPNYRPKEMEDPTGLVATMCDGPSVDVPSLRTRASGCRPPAAWDHPS
jgi:hypothetical protein